MLSIVLASLISFFCMYSTAVSSSGTLDSGYGLGGFTLFNGPQVSGEDYATGIMQQPDGKILVIGNTLYDCYGYMRLVRYNPDGTLDSSFGTGGVVKADTYGTDFKLQPDGKIVVLRGCSYLHNSEVKLLRYNPDGSLDATFGDGGVVNYGDTSGRGYRLAVQPDGKLLVVGAGKCSEVTLYRFTVAGALDTTFGHNGTVCLDGDYSPGGSSSLEDDPPLPLVVQPDGKFLIAPSKAFTKPDGGVVTNLAVQRYNPDGTLDSSFGVAGEVVYDLGIYDIATGMVVQPDGGIVLIAGHMGGASPIVFRLHADGTLDTTFGTEGLVTVAVTSLINIALQADAKIVVTGYRLDYTPDKPRPSHTTVLLRYTAEGVPDATFGVNGMVTYVNEYDAIWLANTLDRALAIQRDGKILIAGGWNNGRDEDLLTARYLTTGALDITFGTGGFAAYASEIMNPKDVGYGVAVQPDGKIIVAGYTIDWEGANALLVRYNPDGTIDTEFGDGGFVKHNETPIYEDNSDDANLSVALQPDGKILASGFSRSNWRIGAFFSSLARYNPDGSIDATFGINGVSVYGPHVPGVGELPIPASSMALQPDGKIVLFSHIQLRPPGDEPSRWGGAILRFNQDGTFDTGFGTGGVVCPDVLGSYLDYGVLQSDGKIVAVGRALIDWTGRESVLAVRLNPDGTLDNTFGDNGVFNWWDTARDDKLTMQANAITLQKDGKIVIGGSAKVMYEQSASGFLLRLTKDGFVDPTFATGGITYFGFLWYDYNQGSCFSVLVDADGNILCVGYADDSTVWRYTSEGLLDETFGTNGRYTLPPWGVLYYGVLQDDGKLVTAGVANNGALWDDVLTVRITNDPAPLPPEPAPDLMITSMTEPPATLRKGARFSIRDIATNVGDTSAGASVTRYYLSSSGRNDSKAILLNGSRSVRALEPGASLKGTVMLTAPSTASGHYYVIACANDTGSVKEDGTNNCLASKRLVNVNTFSLSGSVTTKFRKPIPGVIVAAVGPQNQKATTNAFGQYTFKGLATGSYIITPSKVDYSFSPFSLTVPIEDRNVLGQRFVGN